MKSSKQIEEIGFNALRHHLIEHLGVSDGDIEDMRNKGGTTCKPGCDLVFRHGGRKYYVEMKAFSSSEIPTNIRFTHQTIASFHKGELLNELLVALVYDLAADPLHAKVRFFRFGDVAAEKILVEPHFIIQQQVLREPVVLLHENVIDVLGSSKNLQDLNALFNSPVRQHMRWQK